MKRIDAYSLFRLGQVMSRLSTVEWYDGRGKASTVEAATEIYVRANSELTSFLKLNTYNMKLTQRTGQALLDQVKIALTACFAQEDKEKKVPYDIASPVEVKLRDFETILRAEVANGNLYMVDQKQAFDTAKIIFSGESAFSPLLLEYGDVVIEDARSAMRCIAFELPTAAAFHLHRLNEAVLGIYWDTVKAEERPKVQTLGSYLAELKKDPNHDKLITAALDQIRSIHRNPTMHADHTLVKVDEAIALFGIVSSAVSYMLQAVNANRASTRSTLAAMFASNEEAPF